MDTVWFPLSLVALAAGSVVTGTLYRSGLVGRRRWRIIPALACVADSAALLWLGSRHWWLLVVLVVFTVFILLGLVVGPWTALVWSAPVATLSMDRFTDSFVDRLVRHPAFVARLECYDDHAILDCSYSWLDSFVGRNGVHFPYSGSCVICAVQSAFEAAEAAADDGALAGIAEDFRRQYAEAPRFVLAFKMRPPEVLWQWGYRPGPLTIIPADLCAEHHVTTPSSR